MSNIEKNEEDFDVEIGFGHSEEWTPEKLEMVRKFAEDAAGKRSPERKLKNEMLSIRYQMEDYLEQTVSSSLKKHPLKDFVHDFLKVMDIPFKKFAAYLDTTDGNLNKYLVGDRKLNADLAMKFGQFFHTSPELWIFIQVKNELAGLASEKDKLDKYSKYDYLKTLQY